MNKNKNCCLFCQKELKNDEKYWHKNCIKSFFGSEKIPDFNFNIDTNIKENAANKKSVTGVQPKLSSSLEIKSNLIKKTGIVNEFIIKTNTTQYPYIAQSEYLCMSLAKIFKLNVASFGMIVNSNGDFVYIVKRFDRNGERKIHVEDFCQLSNFRTEYKYHGSYERCASLIRKFSNQPQADITEFFNRLLFCFVTLNSDMHLKNFSLIEDDKIKLSPQYDLLPVQLLTPKDEEETALTIGGKKKNVNRNSFVKFAKNIGINNAEKLINNLLKYEESFLFEIQKSYLPEDVKESFIKEMKNRFSLLRDNKKIME